MSTVYLNAPAVLFIHERILKELDGAPGIRDEGALLAALERPKATFAGQPLYPTLFEKAAALLESLRQKHPFVDGNKRVAFTATDVFLKKNGWRLKVIPDDGETFMLEVAAGKLHKEEITIWLREHAIPHGR